MKKEFILNVLFAVSMILLIACKKDDTKPDPTPSDQNQSRKEWLSKNWQVHQVLNNNTDHTEEFEGFQMEFKSNGVYMFGKTGNRVEGTWEFKSNEQKLLFDKGTADEEIVNILVLNQTDLHLEYTEPANGKTGEQKIIFKFK